MSSHTVSLGLCRQTDHADRLVPLARAGSCLPSIWKPRGRKELLPWGQADGALQSSVPWTEAGEELPLSSVTWKCDGRKRTWLLLLLCTATHQAHHTASLRPRNHPPPLFPFSPCLSYALCFGFSPFAYLACFLTFNLGPPAALVCCGALPGMETSGIWDHEVCAARSLEPVLAFSFQTRLSQEIWCDVQSNS